MHTPDTMPVRHVAALAKLALTENEETQFAQDMAKILQFAAQLKAVDTTGVPMTQHIVALKNVLRSDLSQPSLPCETVLSAAPTSQEGFMTVPNALKEDQPCPSQI